MTVIHGINVHLNLFVETQQLSDLSLDDLQNGDLLRCRNAEVIANNY